jgi:aspartate--ammonia ligase
MRRKLFLKNQKGEGKLTERHNLNLPDNYQSYLDLRETEKAIKLIKDHFQTQFVNELNLQRVSAPLFVLGKTGVNDHLSGVEKPVRFRVKDIGEDAEIVQSLAKWKRMALADYGFRQGEGLYTDMNAIRPEEILDNLHSIYVDQWDWERVINREERNLDFLKMIVRKIYNVIHEKEAIICKEYPQLPGPNLPKEIFFVHTEELEEKYPEYSPKAREDAICKDKGAVFVIGIGAKLKSGEPHDGRAADYDDWITETVDGRKGLNGDIIVWNPVLQSSFELSSMGIRVDRESILKQLEIKGEMYKIKLDYHQKLLNNQLPLTIGGGIGQSRLCMLFLRKAHVGEVQSSIWPEDMVEVCKKKKIFLL